MKKRKEMPEGPGMSENDRFSVIQDSLLPNTNAITKTQNFINSLYANCEEYVPMLQSYTLSDFCRSAMLMSMN